MDELKLFRISEGIKDRYTTIFENKKDFRCSPQAVDEAGPLVAEMILNFDKINADKGTEAAIHYLADTAGYYMILCSDIQKTNKELLDLLEEWANEKS